MSFVRTIFILENSLSGDRCGKAVWNVVRNFQHPLELGFLNLVMYKHNVISVPMHTFSSGGLHRVHHLWVFESLEKRKEAREKSWEGEGWAKTVAKTGKYLGSIH
jgi:NIPSNAP